MEKVILYQKNSGGKIKIWSTWVEENADNTATIYVEHGQLDGKKQLVQTIITSGKNLDKINFTTPYTQAISEAQSDINKKIRKGYVNDLSLIQDSHILGSGIPQPMLANKFDPTMKQRGSKNLEKLKIINENGFTQVKLDGTRCFVNITNSDIQLYSRSGDKYYNFPHIVESIKKSINTFELVKNDIKTIWLDGELYSHSTPFNQLSGLIRKEKRTEEDLIKEKEIKFYIYDIVLDNCYSQRYKLIQHFVDNENVFLTPTTFVESISNEILEQHLKRALENGYEGLMIRQLNSGYEHKRTWNLMKYKTFEDAEFKIVGFKKSTTGETLGSIEFEIENGKRFFATFNGSDMEQKEIWDNKEKYLGLYGTVEYFELSTEYGIPRFPKCTKFRTGLSKD